MKKNKKFNFKVLILPIFIVVTLNLIIGLGMSFSTVNNNNSAEKNMTLIANYNTSNVQTLDSISVFLKAQENLNKATNVRLETKGEVKSFVTQNIYVLKLYDGKTYFTQNITTGFKTFANRIYLSDNKITTIGGTKVTDTNATWNGTTKTYTLQEYKNKFHFTPESYLPYTINAISITNSTQPIENENGYSFTLTLHPEISTKQYAQNIKTTLGTNSLPVFNDIKLKITVDQNFNFKTIETTETFTIKIFGISKECNSKYLTSFNFTDKQNIISAV